MYPSGRSRSAEYLSIGKLRGLQQCSTAQGALAVLALDHRASLRRTLDRWATDEVSPSDLSSFKQEVVASLGPVASAVLLDPEVGAAQCIASGVMPGDVGLVVPLESTGYGGDPGARESQLLPGWNVEKARRTGASAVKLLVYYHPDAPTASQAEALVREVIAECKHHDLLFMLEILTYSIDKDRPCLSPDHHRRTTLESVRRLVLPGVDLLKVQFPVDVKVEPDEDLWADACSELSSMSVAPWMLLSAGVDFDIYLRQVTVACRSGASGVAVGRAVWQEATGLKGAARTHFLDDVARERMARLTSLCNAEAQPWSSYYIPAPVREDWYKEY